MHGNRAWQDDTMAAVQFYIRNAISRGLVSGVSARLRGVAETDLSFLLWNEDRCESCSAPGDGIDADSPDLVLGEAKRARIVERSLERTDRVLDRNRPPA
jgi:hypothetical protein